MNKRTDLERRNFVDPGPKPIVPVKMDILQPDPIHLPVQHHIELSGSYQDRAKGFQISTLPLAIGVGIGSLLIGIGYFKVPFFSVTALLILWLGFLATWVIGWIVTHLFSPEGVGVIGALINGILFPIELVGAR